MLLDSLGRNCGFVGLFLVEGAALGRDPMQLQAEGPAAGDGMAG